MNEHSLVRSYALILIRQRTTFKGMSRIDTGDKKAATAYVIAKHCWTGAVADSRFCVLDALLAKGKKCSSVIVLPSFLRWRARFETPRAVAET